MITLNKNKLYLIDGGSGFLGKRLIKYLLDFGCEIRLVARNEGNLLEIKKEFPSVEIFLGDIADSFTCKQAMNNVDGVFHLAASKHVGMSEIFPRETVKSNIIGTMNILDESLNMNLDFVLAVSTDKAAQVSGVYGASKLIMERLVGQYSFLNLNTSYRVVRYGNVLYSTGSVLCVWKDRIEKGLTVTITDPDVTRFFWTSDDAIELIIQCLANADSPVPYCPEMKSIRLGDLLDVMIEKYANGKDIIINQIGLGKSENMHEKILDDGPYSNETETYTRDEIYEII